MTEQKTGLDFEALRRGIEGSDAEALIGLYADDAEMVTVNKNATPVRRGCSAAGRRSPGSCATSADGRWPTA